MMTPLMRTIKFLSLYLILLYTSSCISENSTHEKVIIAINTYSEIGYYIDCQGNYLFNKQFDYVSSFTDGYAEVKENGKWGVISAVGEIIVPCIYDNIRLISNGYSIAKDDGKYGILNNEGEIVTPIIYDNVREDASKLLFVTTNGKWGAVNTK